jgi:tripartite-type tricarboxylate transporter receptor subunit TctC
MLSLMQRAALLSTLLTAALMMLPSHGVSAEGWPSQSVHLIVPASPGSSLDVVARIVGERLALRWNRPVVVEAKAGAGGMLGMNAVAKAPADGYTLGIGFNGPISIAPHLYRKMAYDPGKDLRPIVLTTSQPNVLAVPTSHPAKTARELVEWARQRDGGLLYASVGNGSSSHLTMELFKIVAGFPGTHVPYKGSPEAAVSVATGETHAIFTVQPALLAFLEAGKLKLLGATSSERTGDLRELPTLAEQGYPAVQSMAWNGLLAPAATPAGVVERINADVNALLIEPSVREALRRQGLIPGGGTPSEFAAMVEQESRKWGPVISEAKIRLD